MKKLMLLCVVTSALSGCATVPVPVPVQGGCQAFSVIYPSPTDAASTKRQVLTHNRTFEAVCNAKTKD